MRDLHDVFADTVFWIATIVKQDQYHEIARKCTLHITGRIITTEPVLLETANALSRPPWRKHAIALIEHIQKSHDIEVIQLNSELWTHGWKLFQDRSDKAWSLTDCISFAVMDNKNLIDVLTADVHFQQAGYCPVLFETI